MNSRRFDWSLSRFDELDVHTLYDALALRSEVFVVEQNCAYADIDELDKLPGSRHLVARCGNTLCAYARSLAPSDTHADARIGRVVVRQSFRRQGLDPNVAERLKPNRAALAKNQDPYDWRGPKRSKLCRLESQNTAYRETAELHSGALPRAPCDTLQAILQVASSDAKQRSRIVRLDLHSEPHTRNYPPSNHHGREGAGQPDISRHWRFVGVRHHISPQLVD